MNYCNYVLFEILKYKIELLDCLEYSMESSKASKVEITKNISYLKNNLKNGLYKDVLSDLFTNYELVNKHLISFFKKYPPKQVNKISKTKKAKKRIEYIKHIIECHENLNNLILSFTNEIEIKNKIEPQIIKLIKTNNSHFTLFLYFVTYNMYICSISQNKTKLKFKENDIKEIISIMKYCNTDNKFSDSMKILEENNELNINNEFERLSNKCIELEKRQNNELKEVINLINNEIEKNKK